MAVAAAALLLASGCSFVRGGDDVADRRVLRIGLVRPSTLDPMAARTVDEQIVAEQLFDTLVALDPETVDGKPGVAESWTVSDDQLVWQFTLAADAEFSDGEQISTADVKATLERIAKKDSGSPVADLLEPVRGWKEFAVDGSASELAGVVADADRVVRIELSTPWSSLPQALAQPQFGIVPSGVTAGSFDDEPVGSGPFLVRKREKNRLTLRRVEGREARLAGLDLRLYDDTAAAYEAFVDDRVDYAPVPPERVAEAATRYGREYFRPYAAELFYAFNLRNPKWQDKRVREAAVRAVDTAAIAEEVYRGDLRPMTSLVPPSLAGAGSCPACGHDPERAKALVAEVTAGGGALPEVAIDFDGDRTQAEVAKRLEADLEAVGFTVTLRPKPLADYQRFAASGEQDLFRLGWVAAYPTADAFVAPLFLSGGSNNLIGFALSGVDELVQRARATADPAARADLYRQADEAILGEFPVLPIGQFQQFAVAVPRVNDLRLSITGTFDASTVWLAAD